MTPFFSYHHFAVFFGLLGNVVSFLVYLSPSPTFYGIYKAKSTQGFESVPYAVALFSSTLTLYYGLIKGSNGGTLLITINSVGIAIESFYLAIYITYAPKKAKLKTMGLLMTLNVGLMGLIILLTSLLTHGELREKTLGWICAVCSVCFFASPLCVIRTVIKTKSVEFMPFWLSFSLTISAIMWFFYGFFIKDRFVAFPNVLGLVFGVTQMTLYFIYKDSTKKIKDTCQALRKLEEEGVKGSDLVVVIEMKEEAAVATKKVEDKDNNTTVSGCPGVVVGVLQYDAV